jgi:hypothetical protein
VASGVSGATLALVNSNSVKLFTSSKLYKEALYAQSYLAKNEPKVKGWLNLVIIKELLLIKAEIDLNYLDIHPSNLEIFGWKLSSPLCITLEVKELKLLNSMEPAELPLLGFAQMHLRSSFEFAFTNDGSN